VTQRDQKTLTIIALALVGAGIAFWLLQTWFLGPLGDYKRQIANLEDEVDSKQQQINGIVRDRVLVNKARARSLPADQVKAMEEYDQYLVTLLHESGLTEVGVIGPNPADLKAAASQSNVPGETKKAAHTVLTYQVKAKGNLASVVKAFDKLQRTPVLHRVKGWTLGRQESSAKDPTKDNLTVQMTIEAMIVAGTKPGYEASLKPDTSLPLPTPNNLRRYSDIAQKNIFLGLIDSKAPPPDVTAEEEIIAEHVRLVYTDPTTQEAFLRTLIFQVPETRVRSKKGSGYDTFRIMNENRSKVLVQAKVLRIDQRDMYFQVKEDVYGIHIGYTMAEAMRRPLSDAELARLELTSLVQEYDPKTDAKKTDSGKKTNRTGKRN